MKKKKHIIAYLIIVIVLGIPLFFINPGRAEQPLLEQLWYVAARLIFALLAGSLGGVVLVCLLRAGVNITVFLIDIENKVEESNNYNRKWSLNNLFELYEPCSYILFLATYICYLLKVF